MASYNVSAAFVITNSTNPVTIAIKAGAFQLRILSIDPTAMNGTMTISRYAGATISGGTILTPAPDRDGAAPALATSRLNGTISGTATAIIVQSPVGASFKFDSDFLISPGNAVLVSTAIGSSYNVTSLGIQFEELHLARSV